MLKLFGEDIEAIAITPIAQLSISDEDGIKDLLLFSFIEWALTEVTKVSSYSCQKLGIL